MGSSWRWMLLVAVTAALGPSTASAERKYSVAISSDPEGASVFIDDPDSDPIGETPFTAELARGTYTLIFEAPGHETLIESLTVTKRRRGQRFSVEMIKKPVGFVKLRPAEAGDDFSDSTILIDDVERQVEIGEKLELEIGAHKLEVIREGYKNYEAYFELEEGQLQAISVNFVASDGSDGGGDDSGFGVSKDAEDEEEDEEEEDIGAGPPLLVAWGGVEWSGRSFKYDDGATMLRDYDFLGARFRLGVESYPLKKFGRWLGGIGLGAQAAFLLGPKSSTNQNGTPDDPSDDLGASHSWTELRFDMRYRYDFSESVWLALAGGYGQNKFVFSAVDAGLQGRLAAVDYKQLSFGALFGTKLGDKGRLALDVHLNQVSQAGEVQSRFSQTTITGFGVSLMGAYALARRLDLQALLVYDRYGYAFGDPPAGSDYIADSAVDQFFGVSLGVGYRL